MLADIAHGHTTGADILFLVAFILFVIDVIAKLTNPAALGKVESILISAGLACLAIAWLIL